MAALRAARMVDKMALRGATRVHVKRLAVGLKGLRHF